LATGWEEKKKKKNRPVVVFRQVADRPAAKASAHL
jgi:hypothetical protein